MRNKMFGVNRLVAGGNTLKIGLLSCWEFNETSGAVAFDSHGSNDGTNVGATINQSGLPNLTPCYSFDGSTNYIDIPEAFNSLTTGTISVWVNLDILGTFNEIFYSGTGASTRDMLSMAIDGNNKFTVSVRSVSAILINWTAATALSASTWYNLVWTMDASGSKFYINAVEETTGTYTYGNASTVAYFNDVSASQEAYIGRQKYSGVYYARFDGLMDQLPMWYRALTQTEITALYNSGNGLAYAYWASGTPSEEELALIQCLSDSLIFEATLPFNPASATWGGASSFGSGIVEDANYIFITFNDSTTYDYLNHIVFRYTKIGGAIATQTIATATGFHSDFHKLPAMLITSSGSLLVSIEQLPANNDHNGPIEIFRWADVTDLTTYTSTVIGNGSTERQAYPFLWELNGNIVLDSRRYSVNPPYRSYYTSSNDGVSFGSMTDYADYGDIDYWLYNFQLGNNKHDGINAILHMNPLNNADSNAAYQYTTFIKTKFDNNLYKLDGTNLGASLTGAEMEGASSWGDVIKNTNFYSSNGAKIFGSNIYFVGSIGTRIGGVVSISNLQIVKVNIDTGVVTTGTTFSSPFSSTAAPAYFLYKICGDIHAKVIYNGSIYYYKLDADLNGITLISSDYNSYHSLLVTDLVTELNADFNPVTNKIRVFRMSDPDV